MLLLGLALGACTSGPPQTGTLLFAEEFDGRGLDKARWQTEMVWGRVTNGQLERYEPSSLAVEDGRLEIVAREVEGAHPYASGVVATFDRYEFTYGYVEIRARMPEGRGLWPAFWLAAADTDSRSEIDVVEFLGHEPDTVHMTMHYDDEADEHHEPQETYRGTDFTDGYHTFAVDWRPGEVVWYIDGVERARQTEGVPDEPMYLIANLAIGGSWAGTPDDTTKFPASYSIDRIRVYEGASTNGPSQASSSQ